MSTVTTIGPDIAKSVFPVHGIEAEGTVIIRRQVRRGQVLKLFASLPPASSAPRRVPQPITGHVSYRAWGIR